jgi:predicted Ser/Thr protein kinase
MQPRDVIAGRFEIERLAGSGGMGSVYRALDRSTGGPVAVKVLHGQTPDHIERFAREAQLLAELRDPGIVGFVASGATPTGEAYLVMQWLEGEGLSERLARSPLSVAETVALGRRVAGALHAAHARGVVHRDLKPSNLFLPGGDLARVLILDFGIARILEDGRTLTRTGTTLGSPGYMSPEQARGVRVEASADVFSLGCVLFRCLAGQPPFTGDALSAMIKAISDPAPLVASFRGDVPPALEALIQRMLAKQPAARPRDAAAVAVELGAIAEGALSTVVPSMPPPPSMAAPSGLWTVAAGTTAQPPTQGTAAAPPAKSRAPVVLLAALGGAVAAVALVCILGVPVRRIMGGGGFGYPCPGIRCAPANYADPQHVDPMEILPHATQLAQSLDRTATLCDITLGNVTDGTVPMGAELRSMAQGTYLMFQFARPSVSRPGAEKSYGVSLLPPGRLSTLEGTCAHTVPLPACTPRAAYHAAIASGVPRGTSAGMSYHHDDTLGPTWEFWVLNHMDLSRRIDGKTCAVRPHGGK